MPNIRTWLSRYTDESRAELIERIWEPVEDGDNLWWEKVEDPENWAELEEYPGETQKDGSFIVRSSVRRL